jgi:hypothetical protein
MSISDKGRTSLRMPEKKALRRLLGPKMAVETAGFRKLHNGQLRNSRVWIFFFNILMFCLRSRRWFVLCLSCIPYLVLEQVSGDRN